MTRRKAAFAIPGDITTLTGGYIYERRLLMGLRAVGHDVAHIELPGTFPEASDVEAAQSLSTLAAVPSEQALILDGLVFGSLPGLEALRAPILAMIHHPLALETGLSPDRAAHLFETERANLTVAQHVLVPSRHTAEILQSRYDVAPDRITIALPGADAPTLPRAPVTPPLILSVGLQHPRKGHDVLLRALATLTDLPWQAVIVGRAHDPGHAADLASLRDDLGLQERVALTGEVPRADLDRLFSQASLFALATRYEGYGLVFDEALRWGLPIVSCQAGAVPDTVPDGAGLLVPVDDAPAFTTAMQRVLTEPDLQAVMARAAALAGAALPGWDATARVASGVLERMP